MQLDERSVDADQWRAVATALSANGAEMVDFLTAVDDPGAGRIEIVLHLVDVSARQRHLLRTWVDRGAPRVDSLADVLPGTRWHEREVHELFGVLFDGNDDLRPLLTDGTADRPLLRTSALPRRLAATWPGAVDPADRPAARVGAPVSGKVAARPRSRLIPPGIPAEWGSASEAPDRSAP